MPYLLFFKKWQHFLNCRLLQSIGGALRIKTAAEDNFLSISLLVFCKYKA